MHGGVKRSRSYGLDGGLALAVQAWGWEGCGGGAVEVPPDVLVVIARLVGLVAELLNVAAVLLMGVGLALVPSLVPPLGRVPQVGVSHAELVDFGLGLLAVAAA